MESSLGSFPIILRPVAVIFATNGFSRPPSEKKGPTGLWVGPLEIELWTK